MAWRKNDPSLGNNPAYLEPRITELELNKIDQSEKGVSVATLEDGKVPSAQLPTIESGGVKTVNDIEPDENGNVSVASFSGDYNDLSNKPTIPTEASEIITTDGNLQTDIDNLKSSGIDGKTLLETSINAKGGTVSKVGNIASFEELSVGINGIQEDVFGFLQPGSATAYSQPEIITTSVNNPTKLTRGARMVKSGLIRVSFELSQITRYGFSPANAQIYVNGTPTGTLRNVINTTNLTSFVEDLAVERDDVISIYGWAEAVAGCRIRFFEIGVDIDNKFVTEV